MNQSIFFRVLQAPILEKAEELKSQVASVNDQTDSAYVFFRRVEQFGSIPASPFAYWAIEKIWSLFQKFPKLSSKFDSRQGLITADDNRFLRLKWEVVEKVATCKDDLEKGLNWAPFAKGGKFSKFYGDIHLLVYCKDDFREIERNANKKYPYLNGGAKGFLHLDKNLFFRPGLTWPRRTTSGISIRPLPKNSIFSDKGPTAFSANDNIDELLALLAIMNSTPFSGLVSLQLGAATAAARSYEVGIIQNTPIPSLGESEKRSLSSQSMNAYRLARSSAMSNETTHVFQHPAIIQLEAVEASLSNAIDYQSKKEAERQKKLASIQEEIDSLVASLYGAPELAKPATAITETIEGEEPEEVNDDDEGSLSEEISLDPKRLASDLLMWCLGVAFGRWDIRVALDPSRLPELQGPFDPLPVCSPGMLVGEDGLPFASSVSIPDYPLPIAWDGVLVDDLDHPRDLVAAVRRVLKLLYQDRAEAIEQEACEILGVADLRTYFSDPKQFFSFHIKRYSKSRRKAPIYWLLQSKKRNYAVWLYYPRLNPDLLFHAGREYVDAKLKLETTRLEELQANLTSYSGTSLKVKEKQIAQQKDLVSELKAFQKELDRVALLQLKPDLNDGVLLNIAPLCDLIPWKEPAKAWRELLSGKYEWSSIGGQLRSRGLVSQ